MADYLECAESMAVRTGKYALELKNLENNSEASAGPKRNQPDPRSGEWLAEEGLSYLDVARHSDSRVRLQRFAE